MPDFVRIWVLGHQLILKQYIMVLNFKNFKMDLIYFFLFVNFTCHMVKSLIIYIFEDFLNF